MSEAVVNAVEAPFPYQGPPELRDCIAGALRQAVDPEVALNIVDVGLVYGVEVIDDIVYVRVTMTSAACPVTDVIIGDIENELDRALPEAWRIKVELVWEPPWTPERMSGKARRFMGW